MDKGSFQKCPFLKILQTLEILEILERFQSVANEGAYNQILEIPQAKRPLSQWPLSPVPLFSS